MKDFFDAPRSHERACCGTLICAVYQADLQSKWISLAGKDRSEVVLSPRPDVSEARKNQILEAALAVFARLGLYESRMDDIAGQAGLSKAALYLYYKSKGATIIAALLIETDSRSG